MLFLILSVVTSTLLIVILKSFTKFQINTFQAIVINYWICTFTGGTIENYYTFQHLDSYHEPWFKFSIILGVSFIILFNLMGWTAQKLGLAIVSIANKLSLLIPVLIAIVYMHESTTIIKIIAILLALVAVIMVTVSKKTNSENSEKSNNSIFIILPLILFFGSGFNDTIVNYVQKSYLLNDGDDSKFVIWIFQFAALIGSLIFVVQLILGKNKLQLKNLIAGICLGVPNYFSMYYLVKALSNSTMPSSLLFPVNNVSIVVLSTIVGIILFKEKLSKIQLIGIGLACFSIIILFF